MWIQHSRIAGANLWVQYSDNEMVTVNSGHIMLLVPKSEPTSLNVPYGLILVIASPSHAPDPQPLRFDSPRIFVASHRVLADASATQCVVK